MYKNATCKGSYVLGTACGNCERCKEELNKMQNQSNQVSDSGVNSLLDVVWREIEKEFPSKENLKKYKRQDKVITFDGYKIDCIEINTLIKIVYISGMPTNWYKVMGITHWMPLPNPPNDI